MLSKFWIIFWIGSKSSRPFAKVNVCLLALVLITLLLGFFAKNLVIQELIQTIDPNDDPSSQCTSGTL
jgi:uncharacterized membrane protein